ncbi:MAG TPA: hypothetical protein VGP47_05560 [Parachlamydiaceae bacterium]|nr:hypothetical protein [Parachlamydiaceae bacterium]
MNNFFLVFITFLLFHLTYAFSLEPLQNAKSISVSNIKCAPQVQKYLQAILKIPEAKTLLEDIQKEGLIQISAKSTVLSKRYGAFWDPDRRVIYVDLSPTRSEGSKIRFLLFELHNASVNSQFKHLNDLAKKGKINKKNYVESMEYLEYINTLKTAKLAEIGIKMGMLPSDSHLQTFSTFKEHFNAQKLSGHSACYAHNYELRVKSHR